jgi:deazaflavin-dependent oxidoreductase (nitroreductase family)
MIAKTDLANSPKLPRGLSRLAFRFPIWLYRLRLGWLLGYRFVLLTHTGRKSGLLRQTVLEVVRYDPVSRACVIASGWGMKSDWIQNITAKPQVIMQVSNKRSKALAERLSPDEGEHELLDYAHRHPMAFRELTRFMGYRLDGSEADIRAAGRMLPMFNIKPVD